MSKSLQIYSGGQTGVDRAALDAALALGIPHGGWCPRGRVAEDGAIIGYSLKETPSNLYDQRTEWNVRDTEGTLVIVRGQPTGGTAYTIDMAKLHGRPYLIVNLEEGIEVRQIITWIRDQDIWKINVAGPRESTTPGIYRESRMFLENLFRLLSSEG